MSSDAPARRLLARLVDEQAVEAEPIAEVRADLAALGLDPAHATALAKRMAAGGASPALALLGKIAAVDEGDDEIARLERAEADAVRRRVGEGIVGAAIANAQRAAGGQSSVTALRRRRPRRLLYGLGGIAVALAASLVFYVGLSSNPIERQGLRDEKTSATQTASTGPAMQTAASSGPASTGESGTTQAPATPAPQPQPAEPAPAASATDDLQARMAPTANEPKQSAQQEEPLAAPLEQAADAEVRAKAEQDLQKTAPERLSESELESELAKAQMRRQAGSVTLGTPGQFSGTAGQSNAQQLVGGTQQNQIAAPFGLDRPVTALLIVDPRLVPSTLKQESYQAGDLPARLADARRLAGVRRIAALVTLQLGDHAVDAIIVAGGTGEVALRRDLDKADSQPATAPGYDVILLDRR